MTADPAARRQVMKAAAFALASAPFALVRPRWPTSSGGRGRSELVGVDTLSEEINRLEILLAAHSGSPWVYDCTEVTLDDPLVGRIIDDAQSRGSTFPALAVAEAIASPRIFVLKRDRLAPLIAYGGADSLSQMPDFDPDHDQRVKSSSQNVFLATIPVSREEAVALPRLPESAIRAHLERILRAARLDHQLA
jgi:hypothetical protein